MAEAAPKRRKSQRLSEAIDYMITATCHDKADGTREMYEIKGRRIIATLGDPNIADVSREMINDFIGLRLKGSDTVPKGARGTIGKELITIRKALAVAYDRGLLVTPAAAIVPNFKIKYVPRERWLTVPEFEMLWGEFGGDRALWVAIATLAGLRSSEVEAIEWRHIDLVGGWIQVPGTKTATSRRKVAILPGLHERLTVAVRLIAPVRLTAKVVRPWGNVRRDIHAACSKLGIAKASPNDLRRTFASWLKQQGADSQAVATMMGHASTRMVELVYGKLDDASYRRAIAVLPEGLLKTVTTPVTSEGQVAAFCGPLLPSSTEPTNE